MQLCHRLAGVLVVVGFLLTGVYMRTHDPEMTQLPDVVRMLYRSRHIYLLFAGLLNLVLGAYWAARPPGWRRIVQLTGSALLLLAPILLAAAFFREPGLPGMDRTFSLPAIESMLAGSLCHAVSGWRRAS